MKFLKGSAVGFGAVFGAAAMVLGAASTATAGTYVGVSTTDRFPGGLARWGHYGDKFSCADKDSDGYRASCYPKANGKTYRLDDAGGADNGDAVRDFNFTEGITVGIKACLRDGYNGTAKFCSGWKYGKA